MQIRHNNVFKYRSKCTLKDTGHSREFSLHTTKNLASKTETILLTTASAATTTTTSTATTTTHYVEIDLVDTDPSTPATNLNSLTYSTDTDFPDTSTPFK